MLAHNLLHGVSAQPCIPVAGEYGIVLSSAALCEPVVQNLDAVLAALRDDEEAAEMRTLAQAIETYIRAKDENRPHLLSGAFAEDASVQMVVNTSAISFPPSMSGLDAIADTLVRRFGQINENIYTFCLSHPPEEGHHDFTCRWLVGMTEKENQTVRVGIGVYHWVFRKALIEELKITIDAMQTLDPAVIDPVIGWLSSLPYPWCPLEVALKHAPDINDLAVILEHAKSLMGVRVATEQDY